MVVEDDEAYAYEEDEEDEEDEEEEEEEEEDVVGNKRRRPASSRRTGKRSRVGRSFVDIEAAVGDEDDEDEEYEEEAAEASQAEREATSRHRLRQQDLGTSGQSHFASKVGDLERRFQDARYNEDLFDDEDDEVGDGADEEGAQAAFGGDGGRFISPGPENRLWIVRINAGFTEKEAVISIMNKGMQLRKKNLHFPILSAIAIDALKNQIYVEAENAGLVQNALSGMRCFNFSREIKHVPFKEMNAIFWIRNKTSQAALAHGSFVRVRGGLYAGDLAQVLDGEGPNVTIRLVPRVDFTEEIERCRPGGGAMRKTPQAQQQQQPKTKRPPRRFFQQEDMHLRGIALEQGQINGTLKFAGRLFEETGYLVRRVQLSMLVTGDAVQQTPQEIREFSSGRLNEAELEKNQQNMPTARAETYQPGEAVVVLRGDLAGLKGVVQGSNGQDLRIQRDANKPLVEVNCRLVAKYFDIGSSVQVVRGANAGATGLVTAVNLSKLNATVFHSATCGTVDYPLADITRSSGTSGGRWGLQQVNGFAVGDLVQLSTNQFIGCITRIDPAKTFSVLLPGNQTCDGVLLSQIATKRSSVLATATDRNGRLISVRAQVQVDGRCGKVLHIWKGCLFVKGSREDMSGAGIFTATASEARLVGIDASAPPPTATSTHSAPARGGWGGRGGRGGGRPRRGRHVRIVQGRQKGSLAELESTDHGASSCTVRLAATGKILNIPLSSIELVPDSAVHDSNSSRPSSVPQQHQQQQRMTWESYFSSGT